MSMRRPLVLALFSLAGFVASACTAILVPDEDDDGVQRCNNLDDCDDIEDNRYTAQCVRGDDQPANSDSFCAAEFATNIACGPEIYDADHPLTAAFEDATDVDSLAAYGSCSEENLGARGCPPAGTSCQGELVLRADNICDVEEDPAVPAMYPPDVGLTDIAGQDALDQFCRQYFCDERFVCNTQTSRCQPCSGTAAESYGSGGCGQLFIEGAPSPMYTDINSDISNCGGTLSTEELVFGDAPTVEEDG